MKFGELSPGFLRIAFAELNKIDYSWFACFADKKVLSPAFNHLSDSTRRGRLLDVLIKNVYHVAKLKGIKGVFIDKGMWNAVDKKELEDSLHLLFGTESFVMHLDSKSVAGLQLADLAAGALHAFLKQSPRKEFFESVRKKMSKSVKIVKYAENSFTVEEIFSF